MIHTPFPGDPKWDEFIDAIRTKKKVILTSDEVSNDGHSFRRTGYIALFSIDEFELSGSDLSFRFVKRLVELK